MADETKGSPQRAPDFALHRIVTANDSLPVDEKKNGMLMQDYQHAVVQVVPSGGDNPVVSVLFWSEEADEFVPEHTALDYAAKGANTPWQIEVACYGRSMLVAVTAGSGAGETKIYVSGFNPSQV